MAVMVLNNQAQSFEQRLSQIQETLHVDLPNQRASLEADIAENERQQAQIHSEIEDLNQKLKGLRIENKSNVAEAQQMVRQREARVASMVPTQVLVEPSRSLQPVGTSSMLIVALGGVLGLMLGVFAAFAAELAAAARARSSEQREEAGRVGHDDRQALNHQQD
jgi:uncharacterized protein involved in exopolysaccharide biosynthesis